MSSLDAIKGVSTLTLMDLVYVVAYATIIVTFGQIIWDNHRIKVDADDVIKKVAYHDRVSFAIQLATTIVVFVALLLTHR